MIDSVWARPSQNFKYILIDTLQHFIPPCPPKIMLFYLFIKKETERTPCPYMTWPLRRLRLENKTLQIVKPVACLIAHFVQKFFNIFIGV